MVKNGGLSKTARASLGLIHPDNQDHLTDHIDPISGERIMLSQLMPVKVMQKGRTHMVYYNKNTYRLSEQPAKS
jgi:hypothetical protein